MQHDDETYRAGRALGARRDSRCGRAVGGSRLRPRPSIRLLAASRLFRELGSIGSALVGTSHPYMAQIVPMRRCNLACTYCNEYDDVSKPVDLDEMLRRIDEIGGPTTHNNYPWGWTMAGNTPFKRWKRDARRCNPRSRCWRPDGGACAMARPSISANSVN